MSESGITWTLVLYSAPWCLPGAPMQVIFNEVVRELAQCVPEDSFTGVVVDVDDETNRATHDPVLPDALASVDFLPLIVLYQGDIPERSAERLRLVGQLPKQRVRSELLAVVTRNAQKPAVGTAGGKIVAHL